MIHGKFENLQKSGTICGNFQIYPVDILIINIYGISCKLLAGYFDNICVTSMNYSSVNNLLVV